MNTYLYLLNGKQFKEALHTAEKEVYLKAYQYSGYNQAATAKLVGVSRGTARTKLKEYLIEPENQF